MAYSTRLDDEEERNEKGQWAPGVSGNPFGRPRKVKAKPKGLAEEIAAVLEQQVPVVENGEKQEITIAAVLVKKAVLGALKGSPKEQLLMLEKLEKLGAFNFLKAKAEEEDEEPVFTEEHKRILAEIVREIDLDDDDDDDLAEGYLR